VDRGEPPVLPPQVSYPSLLIIITYSTYTLATFTLPYSTLSYPTLPYLTLINSYPFSTPIHHISLGQSAYQSPKKALFTAHGQPSSPGGHLVEKSIGA